MEQFENRSLLILGLLVLCSSFLGINSGPLWNCLEAANGGVIRELSNGGGFFTLQILEEPAFQLAPLYYWLSAGFYYLVGDGPFSVRFWSPVASILTVLLFYLGVTNLFNELAGFLAALVLTSSLQFMLFSKAAVVDNLLLLCLLWTVLSYIYRNYLFMYVGWAVATLVGGSLGFILPGTVIFLHALLVDKERRWREMHKLPGLLLVVLLLLPWYGGLYYFHGGEALLQAWDKYYFDGLVAYPYATAGWWYYLLALALGCMPWLGLTLLSLKHAFYDSRIDDLRKLEPFFIWLLVGLGLLSWHGVKSPVAVLLLLPPVAVLVGWNLARLKERQRQSTTYTAWMYLSGLTLGLGAWGSLQLGAHLGGELVFIGQITALLLVLIGVAIVYTLWQYKDVLLATWLHALAGLATMFIVFVFALPLVADTQNVAKLSDWYRHHCAFEPELYVERDLRQGFYFYAGRTAHPLPQGPELQQLLQNGQLKYFLVDRDSLPLLPKDCKVLQQVGHSYLLEQR